MCGEVDHVAYYIWMHQGSPVSANLANADDEQTTTTTVATSDDDHHDDDTEGQSWVECGMHSVGDGGGRAEEPTLATVGRAWRLYHSDMLMTHDGQDERPHLVAGVSAWHAHKLQTKICPIQLD